MLVRNVRPEGTTRTGKLASYWNPVAYEVIEKLKNVPVFVVREWGTNKKARVLHRNLLKRVSDELFVTPPVETQPSKVS